MYRALYITKSYTSKSRCIAGVYMRSGRSHERIVVALAATSCSVVDRTREPSPEHALKSHGSLIQTMLRRSGHGSGTQQVVVVVEKMGRVLMPEPSGIESRCGRARAVTCSRMKNTFIISTRISIRCLTATDCKSGE